MPDAGEAVGYQAAGLAVDLTADDIAGHIKQCLGLLTGGITAVNRANFYVYSISKYTH